MPFCFFHKVHVESYYCLSLASPLSGIGFASGDGNTIIVHYYDCLLLKIHFQQIKKTKNTYMLPKRKNLALVELDILHSPHGKTKICPLDNYKNDKT